MAVNLNELFLKVLLDCFGVYIKTFSRPSRPKAYNVLRYPVFSLFSAVFVLNIVIFIWR